MDRDSTQSVSTIAFNELNNAALSSMIENSVQQYQDSSGVVEVSQIFQNNTQAGDDIAIQGANLMLNASHGSSVLSSSSLSDAASILLLQQGAHAIADGTDLLIQAQQQSAVQNFNEQHQQIQYPQQTLQAEISLNSSVSSSDQQAMLDALGAFAMAQQQDVNAQLRNMEQQIQQTQQLVMQEQQQLQQQVMLNDLAMQMQVQTHNEPSIIQEQQLAQAQNLQQQINSRQSLSLSDNTTLLQSGQVISVQSPLIRQSQQQAVQLMENSFNSQISVGSPSSPFIVGRQQSLLSSQQGAIIDFNQSIASSHQSSLHGLAISSARSRTPASVKSVEELQFVGDSEQNYTWQQLAGMTKDNLIKMVLQLQNQLYAGQREPNYRRSSEGTEISSVHKCCWQGCNLLCPTVGDLREHIVEVHIAPDESGKYICHWENCSRNKEPFQKRLRILNHIAVHTKEKPFCCPVEGCGKSFSRKDSLTTHLKTHSGVKEFVCHVEGCGKSFYHQRTLRKHLLGHPREIASSMPSQQGVDAAQQESSQ
ncbi:hypothetical protein MIR68_012527 [Amoeboaphelidium protococcarum]|nr:hypothetical protein MIR68_012527 [Amoeboaphelidium protococcarum]